MLYGDANATKGRVIFSADGLIRHPVLTDPILKARVAVVRDPSVDQVVFGLRSISRTTAWQLHSPAELAAVVRASTHHEFSRLGAANRAFAAACGPVLGEVWSAEMILQFAGAYDDCVSGREATAGPSYTC